MAMEQIKLTVDTKPLLDALEHVKATVTQAARTPSTTGSLSRTLVGVAAAACASTRRVSRRSLLGLSWWRRDRSSGDPARSHR